MLCVTAIFPIPTPSDCSIDGVDPATMLCERAAALGLRALTVTDHCECDAYLKDGYDKAIRQSFLKRARRGPSFRDRLRVYAGMELAAAARPGCGRKGAFKLQFYFVLGSVHNLRDKEDFYFLDYGSVNSRSAAQCILMSCWRWSNGAASIRWPT